MKDEDDLFCALFKVFIFIYTLPALVYIPGYLIQEVHHTGSFYDGLRVGDAKEFDLNLVLDLEKNLNQRLRFKLDHDGFVRIELTTSWHNIYIPPSSRFYPVKETLFKTIFEQPNWSSPHLDTDKVKRWMQGIWSKIDSRARVECRHRGIKKVRVYSR